MKDKLINLAKKYDTPLYVYDGDKIIEKYTTFKPCKKKRMLLVEMVSLAWRRRGGTGGSKICTNMFSKVLDENLLCAPSLSAEWWGKAESRRCPFDRRPKRDFRTGSKGDELVTGF